jgi:predicted Zn-dependent protease
MKLHPVLILLCLVVLEACQRVPVTGRRQLNLVGESTLMGMASTAYTDFLSQTPPLPASDQRVQEVRTIGNKLAAAATQYLQSNNAGDRVKDFEWEFNVVNDPSINAWAMPGGKVVVYTGILDVTRNTDGLAVVMGHEIAHAIARHGNERMSQAIALQGAGMTLDVLTSERPGLARDIFMQSVGVGGQLGMLAYSRRHESEADRMGLIFMAMAGYDPREAPKFWGRMGEASEGQARPPELLSTHPSDQTRMRDLERYMNEAMKYYKPGS